MTEEELVLSKFDKKAYKGKGSKVVVDPKVHQALLQATKKLWAVVDDIGNRNPGWLGKLVLSDYALLNEAFIEVPRAIKAAERKS
jgi:hypothetical protein